MAPLDPVIPHALDEALATMAGLRASSRPCILFVGHGWGGGVRRHMDDLAALVHEHCQVILAEPGPGGTVRITVGGAGGRMALYFALPAEMTDLAAMLGAAGVCRIHFHHVHGLPRAVLDLPDALGVPYDWTLHDYHLVDPRLVAAATGAPAEALPWDLSLAGWHELFGTTLRQAARVIAPSHDVAQRMDAVWPGLKVAVWPHPEPRLAAHPPVTRVVTPGRISPDKGLHVIAACALDARDRELPLFFRILGCTTEPVVQAPVVPLTVSGEYPESALTALLAAEKPDVMLLPSQVPETFGYVLSAGMRAGLPIVASQVGAFVERLADYPQVLLLPPNAAAAQWNDALLRVGGAVRRPVPIIAAAPGLDPAAYRDDYLAPLRDVVPRRGPEFVLAAKHVARPRDDVGSESLPLATLYTAGVACGQAESRAELERRLNDIAAERAVGEEEQAQAAREQRAIQARLAQMEHVLRLARARIEEFEHSTSWRVTTPLRMLARRWRLAQARWRTLHATARHVPRQADIARSILRSHGAAALWTRVVAKLTGKRRFRPPPVLRYVQEEAAGPLVFPPFGGAGPRVSIIIPAFGDPLLTFTCLRSILAATPAGRFEVIVIDDASPVPLREALPDLRGITLERNPVNAGFIASCNRGAAIAQGEVLLFLNNDTIVTPGWLQAILHIFETRPQAGVVGVKLIYPDGRLQEAGGIVWRDGSAWNCGRDEDPEQPEHNYVREVDYCSGACIAVPAVVFRAVGGFDVRYAPAYYEDTDLGFAVRASGRKVVYQPRAVVVHFEGRTSGTDLAGGVKQHQVTNQRRFAEKWSTALAAHRANGVEPGLERDRWARHRVLVIDACMLTPDQDSGSVRMQAILELLLELHCKVTFVADSLEYREPYVTDLQQRGVEVLFHPYVSDVPSLLAERGGEFDVIMLSRHYIAAKHVGSIRTFAPRALLVFDTVDLHFLRSERLAELEGSAMAKAAARAKRDEELALIAKSDLTLVVSPIEHALLRDLAPRADVAILSNIHELIAGGRPFAERDGLVFIGGFQHPPNADAVLWYAREVLPHVRTLLPGVKTTIVGADAPANIRALASDDFVVAGYVPDIAPYFTRSRVSISPLRYGAGVKGKVNLALSYGLPVVATSASVEGMHLTPGEDVLVADTPLALAQAIARAYDDELLWHRLAEGGRAVIRQHFSRDVARVALAAVLARVERRRRVESAPVIEISAA
ncbi:MAG: glycosyltransferase [Casimicrobiaceae bacterium]